MRLIIKDVKIVRGQVKGVEKSLKRYLKKSRKVGLKSTEYQITKEIKPLHFSPAFIWLQTMINN